LAGTLIPSDLDGRVLDAVMGSTAAISVPVIATTQVSYVKVGQQLRLSANKSYVVAVVFDTFVGTGQFTCAVGSASTISASGGDWTGGLLTIAFNTSPGFFIAGFGYNGAVSGIGIPVPVYQSTTFDFSILIVNDSLISPGSSFRTYLVGVNF
jgi:hypothetical protein